MIERRSFLAAVAVAAISAPAGAFAQSEAATTQGDLRLGVDRLSFLRGKWDVLLHSPTADGAWREDGESTIIVAASMNDLYLETVVQSGPYLCEIIFSYDVVQDRYRVTSRDDQSGLMDVYEGDFDANGSLAVSNLESGTHCVSDGARYHNRMRFTMDSAGGWVWLVEATGDSGASWRPQIKSVAKRAG
jgi:hypothetical protein